MKEKSKLISRREILRLGALSLGGLFIPPPGLEKSGRHFLTNQKPGSQYDQSQSTPPPNPLLEKLGFSSGDRVLIVQADNLGICQSNLDAFIELTEQGTVTSGTVVVPGAWFPLAAHYSRVHSGVDIGVCLTLTSQFDAIRWRPLSTTDPKSGLVDLAGYLPKSAIEVPSAEMLESVAKELDTQLQRAVWMGIHPTHLDCHQAVLYNPVHLPDYAKIASHNNLPLALIRADENAWRDIPGVQPGWVPAIQTITQQLEDQGYLLLDNIYTSSGLPVQNRIEASKQVIDSLKPGVHLFKISPARDTPELRAMTNDWQIWAADYATWTDSGFTKYLHNSGVQFIGWSKIQSITSPL